MPKVNIVEQRKPFVIYARTNPSTGDSLHILLSPNLQLINSTFEPDKNPNLLGASRTKKFTIIGTKPGLGYVSIFNHRDWESLNNITPKYYKIKVV